MDSIIEVDVVEREAREVTEAFENRYKNLLTDYLKSLVTYARRIHLDTWFSEEAVEDLRNLEEAQVFNMIGQLQESLCQNGHSDFWRFPEYLKNRVWILF